MRDKLIELIDNFVHNFDIKQWYSDELDEKLADYLIKNITNWISVNDRLPDVGVIVLCVDVDGKQTVAEYSDSYRCFFSGQFAIENITHWQPLPEPPKGD